MMHIVVPVIGFSVGLTNDNRTSGTIKFDAIIRNVGGNYNSCTGIFTAPKRGTYFFSIGTYPDRFVSISTCRWSEYRIFIAQLKLSTGRMDLWVGSGRVTFLPDFGV